MDQQNSSWNWRNPRHPLVEIAFVFLCIFLLTKYAGPLVINSSQNDLFTIGGTGEAKGVPSKAAFALTVTAKDTTEKAVTDELNTRVKQITGDLIRLGIAEKDIKTTNFESHPEYLTSPVPLREQTSTGVGSSAMVALPPIAQGAGNVSQWTASETVQVQANSVDLAQKALAAAQSDGADPSVDGVQFTLDSIAQKQLEQEARIAAIRDAKTKAQELAKESGIRLGHLVNVVENGSPLYQTGSMMKSDAAQSTPAPQLNPGQNTVTKTVTLYYETR